MSTVIAALKERGCVQDASHLEELEHALQTQSLKFYCGFDPTAESLHVGSMLPLIIMRRLQDAGHQPIVLLGSGTGMIGDPSGKSEERKLLDEETLTRNVAGLERQVALFLRADGPNGYQLVKNHEWLQPFSLIDFLREVGKHFSVNSMLAKDSVKSRLDGREQGISFTEFSYQLLQAYDFLWLYQHKQCVLQVGGSDQWGNITAGLDLIRRKTSEGAPSAFGMTFPLLTTSTGAKFGKTEKGAVWLDAARTSPYQFLQYWMNTADADVLRYIKLFTNAAGDELHDLERAVAEKPEGRAAQSYLATTLTQLIHGKEETARALDASKLLFGGSLDGVAPATLLEVFSEVPSFEITRDELGTGVEMAELLVRAAVVSSKGAARRLVEGGGLYINNERITEFTAVIEPSRFIGGAVIVIRSGKKNYHLVKLI